MQTIIRMVTFIILVLQVSVGFAQNGIPSSPRSREAIRSVEPMLVEKLAAHGLKYGDPIYIRIFKEEKQLEVWVQKGSAFVQFRSYPVCTWGDRGLGPKLREGDGKAPEGFYYVTPGSLNPLSSFHLAFNLGYPNQYDSHHGRTGSFIMIHGSCVSDGCFAMTDPVIEDLFALAGAAFRQGQRFVRVHIFPFRLSDEKLAAHRQSAWFDFWKNLKEGYDFFEVNNIPPNVEVGNGRYVFLMP